MTCYEIHLTVMSDWGEEKILAAVEDLLMDVICKDGAGGVRLVKKTCPNGEAV